MLRALGYLAAIVAGALLLRWLYRKPRRPTVGERLLGECIQRPPNQHNRFS